MRTYSDTATLGRDTFVSAPARAAAAASLRLFLLALFL
jgi:hypothetical protein